MFRFELLLFLFFTCQAYAFSNLSNTRESPIVKKQFDFSVGAGYTYLPTPFRGGSVDDEPSPTFLFLGGRFGLFDDLEVQLGGLIVPFGYSTKELRLKWRWLHQNEWMAASSFFAFDEGGRPEASGQDYGSRGWGASTTVGYSWTPAWTSYLGAKLIDLRLEYRDTLRTGAASDVSIESSSVVPSVFTGATYQFFLGPVPIDLDALIYVIPLRKDLAEDATRTELGLTLSLWWRH